MKNGLEGRGSVFPESESMMNHDEPIHAQKSLNLGIYISPENACPPCATSRHMVYIGGLYCQSRSFVMTTLFAWRFLFTIMFATEATGLFFIVHL